MVEFVCIGSKMSKSIQMKNIFTVIINIIIAFITCFCTRGIDEWFVALLFVFCTKFFWFLIFTLICKINLKNIKRMTKYIWGSWLEIKDQKLIFWFESVDQNQVGIKAVTLNMDHWLWTPDSFQKFQNTIFFKISKIPFMG